MPAFLSESHPSYQHHLAIWVTTGLFIPCLSAVGRLLQHWTYQHLGKTAVAWMIGLMLIGLGMAAIRWLAGQNLNGNHKTLILVSVALILVFITIIALLPRTEERLHFVTFGLFGFISKRLFPTWLAVIFTTAWAAGDELFQAWLPDRVGDWRDVGMNTLAGAIGIGLAWLGTQRKPSSHTTHPGS